MSYVCMDHVKPMNASPCTYEWVMTHVWTSHVTRMNASRHTYETVTWLIISHFTYTNAFEFDKCVTTHVWMSHVTHINGSRRTYERVTLHIWMRHESSLVTLHSWKRLSLIDESHHTLRWDMSHIWTSHGTRTKESCHTILFLPQILFLSFPILLRLILFLQSMRLFLTLSQFSVYFCLLRSIYFLSLILFSSSILFLTVFFLVNFWW